MAIYGIEIQKLYPDGSPITNVYYTDAGDASEALDIGDVFVVGERLIFGATTRFQRLRSWLVGSSTPNFTSKPLTGFGNVAVTTAVRKEITLDCEFGVSNSYPGAKYYRTGYSANYLSGVEFSSDIDAYLDDFQDFMAENFFRLTTRNGSAYSSFSASRLYGVHQYKKRWYNRTPQDN